MTRQARKALGQVLRSPKNRKVVPVTGIGEAEPVETPKPGDIITMSDGTKYRRTEHGNLVKVQ